MDRLDRFATRIPNQTLQRRVHNFGRDDSWQGAAKGSLLPWALGGLLALLGLLLVSPAELEQQAQAVRQARRQMLTETERAPALRAARMYQQPQGRPGDAPLENQETEEPVTPPRTEW